MGVPLANLLAEAGHTVYITSRKERKSLSANIKYIQGNARDDSFLFDLLSRRGYDAIVDFMHYHTDVFEQRLSFLLNSTRHYFFLSSCRVFAPNDNRITEDSDRLLDVSEDKGFLSTDEYALAKARCENLLFQARSRNWSIIRPYITYNEERLQLSMYEKGVWLRRALSGKSIVFSEELANKKTTLTSGTDVAKIITNMIQHEVGFGEAFNVVGNDSISWTECLNIYLDIIETETGKRPGVVWTQDTVSLGRIIGNIYKLRFDRLSNRVFDNSKVVESCNGEIEFETIKHGLERCLKLFLNSGYKFNECNPVIEGYLDRCSGEHSRMSSFHSTKSKFQYLLVRYLPFITYFYPRQRYW